MYAPRAKSVPAIARRPFGPTNAITASSATIVVSQSALSPMAEAMIGEAVIAIEMGATVEDIGLSIHAHPTFGESIMEAAEALHGKAIHIANTPVKA